MILNNWSAPLSLSLSLCLKGSIDFHRCTFRILTPPLSRPVPSDGKIVLSMTCDSCLYGKKFSPNVVIPMWLSRSGLDEAMRVNCVVISARSLTCCSVTHSRLRGRREESWNFALLLLERRENTDKRHRLDGCYGFIWLQVSLEPAFTGHRTYTDTYRNTPKFVLCNLPILGLGSKSPNGFWVGR